MKYLYPIILLMYLGNSTTQAQTPTILASNASICSNQIKIYFTLEDFTNIQGFQFSTEWDKTKLSYVSIQDKHPSQSSGLILNANSTAGFASASWFNAFESLTATNGDTLFSFLFDVIDDTSPSDILFSDSPTERFVTIFFIDQVLMTVDGQVRSCFLPVDLAIFEARILENEQAIQLNWETSNEENLSYFEIERSPDNIAFRSIGMLKSKKNQGGRYQYIDQRPLEGNNYYRLKSTNEDGSFSYSKIISIKSMVRKFSFLASPNPVKDNLTIRITTFAPTTIDISIYNSLGILVYSTSKKTFSQGTNLIELDIGNFSSGFYLLNVNDRLTNTAYSRKVLKY